MVNSESEVLPTALGIPRDEIFQQHDEQGTALHLEEGAEECAEDLSEIKE